MVSESGGIYDERRKKIITRKRVIEGSYYPGKKVPHPAKIPTRRASEGSEALPSLARRVNMSFFGAGVIRSGHCMLARARHGKDRNIQGD